MCDHLAAWQMCSKVLKPGVGRMACPFVIASMNKQTERVHTDNNEINTLCLCCMQWKLAIVRRQRWRNWSGQYGFGQTTCWHPSLVHIPWPMTCECAYVCVACVRPIVQQLFSFIIASSSCCSAYDQESQIPDANHP